MSDAPLMLSVSGARGIVGKTMTPQVARDFAAAFGSFVRASSRQASPMLCLGRDSRPSGEELAAAAMEGLISTGCNVIDLGIVATPTVAVMIGRHSAAGGMVITASHNPIEWNGLKCLNADGVAPPPEQAQEIIRRYQQKDLHRAAPAERGAIARDDTANQTHVQRVLANIPDVDALRRAKVRVVLDSVNGAGCVSGSMLLEALGCEVVHINGEPTGQFAHTPEPTQENLRDLAARTSKENAACGFAQDPDADRLAIIDEQGAYIGEEYTLVLAAKRVLDLRAPLAPGSAGGSKPMTVIATNLSTSRMIDDVAARYPGVRVLRTAVGEANVVAAMKPLGPAALLGGEGNGGVIFPPVCWVRDSLSAMALTLSLLVAERKPLSAIVGGLPKYFMLKCKFDLAKIGGLSALQPAMEKVTKRFTGARISTLDGIRLDFPDGWVHLRPSNTESIVRLIAEAKTQQRAEELVEEVVHEAGLR